MTIPPALLKLMNATVGTEVSLSVTDGQLIASPVRKASKRYPLSELLKGADAMRELNAQTAWARDGDAVGRELS
jgi:antitoxin ChpS